MNLFDVCVDHLVFSRYFMSGLRLDAGAFFAFYIILILGFLCLTLFFRFVAVLTPDFDYAIKVFILILVDSLGCTANMVSFCPT
jgi:hypothetical protein